jgi:[ribosomal protein S5]-alanine N-acetyltransferase
MGETTRAPHAVTTSRLVLRKPVPDDAVAMFERYARDRETLKYMSWPAHESIAETRAFLEVSEKEWNTWPAGPYVILRASDGLLLGGTGFFFETPEQASTGYVLARDAWGKGYATEALVAIVRIARALAIRRLSAVCHAEHRASARVLEKAGFVLEVRRKSNQVFPNLGPEPQDVLVYAMNPLLQGPPA